MYDPVAMQILESEGTLVEYAPELVLVDAELTGCVEFQQVLLDVFEHHAYLPLAPEDLLQFYDVRVVERGCDLQLSQHQLLDVVGVAHLLYGHHLVG